MQMLQSTMKFELPILVVNHCKPWIGKDLIEFRLAHIKTNSPVE